MKERPILFKAEMVYAILEGKKSMTRRVMKVQPVTGIMRSAPECACRDGETGLPLSEIWVDVHWMHNCPYGKPGDQLYVRETYYQKGHWEPVEGVKSRTGKQKWAFIPHDDKIRFEAPEFFRKARSRTEPELITWHKRLARFMPKKYSRIQLEITNIRVERLNDISEEDAEKEGARPAFGYPGWDGVSSQPRYQWGFHELWESINGKQSWDANPWVWVVEFKKVN